MTNRFKSVVEEWFIDKFPFTIQEVHEYKLINDNTTLSSWSTSSLDVIELFMKIENEYGITISLSDMSYVDFTRMRFCHMCNFIERKYKNKNINKFK